MNIVGYSLILIMLLVPLPLGSTIPLAEVVLAAATAFALLVWAWRGPFHNIRCLAAPAIMAGLVVLWAVVMALPLGFPHPAWGPDGAGTLSITPEAHGPQLMRLLTFIALFFLAFQVGADSKWARRLLVTLAFSATAYAVYGLVAFMLGNTHILWLSKWAYHDSLTGTHINRNSFAAYCGMGLLAIGGLLIRHVHHHGQSLRQAWQALRVMEWLLLGCLPILGAALILTDSRGGLMMAAMGFMVLLIGAVVARVLPMRLAAILTVTGMLAGGLLVVTAGHGLTERYSWQLFQREDRPDIWQTGLRIVTEAPWTGHGLGSYETMFRTERDENVGRHFARAHNAYLEWVAEIGVLAALLWFMALSWVLLSLWAGVRQGRSGFTYPLTAFAIMVMAACHSAFDFSYQITANAALLAIVCGAGVAQSRRGTN